MDKYTYNLGQLFEEIVEKYAERRALIFLNGTNVSYSQLNNKANQLANLLLDKNLGRTDVVAIINTKSLESFAIMLACLKIGVIYSNIDGNSPRQRLSRMIETCKPSLFFAPENKIGLLKNIDYPSDKIIEYTKDNFIEDLVKQSSQLNYDISLINGSNPAYLMFTSGSTGFPKGVIISHKNILNFIKWTIVTYNTTPHDKFTNVNPIHFDNSVFDFYASIFTGAGLIPISELSTKNPRKMIVALNRIKPTVWFSVPSMLVYILKLRALTESDLPDLRIITFGGEGFPKAHLRKLWKILSKRVKLINVYGPTECTCICSSYVVTESDMEKDELLPLGPIASNFGQIIINETGNPVKNGEVGELCIAGPNVGIGYYNNLERTKKSFVQNPMQNSYSEIVYKSGDLVKYDPEKNLLYFCGRSDNQIKRMGYRIELEEIENALGAMMYIEESGVIYQKHGDTGKIIAFVDTNELEETILTDLKHKIPSYMLPDEFVFHGHLPKNQNGKIDRLQLKEIYVNR